MPRRARPVTPALLAIACAAATLASPARAEVDGAVFTSEAIGVRAEVPRNWRVSETSGYPDVLLWMSRSRPRVKIVVTADPIAEDCRTDLDAVFCSRDVAQVAAALRAQIAAAGFTITAQEQSRTPELYYQAGGRYLRHALVVVGDHVVSVVLVADSPADRSQQSRVFERLTQSVRPLLR